MILDAILDIIGVIAFILVSIAGLFYNFYIRTYVRGDDK